MGDKEELILDLMSRNKMGPGTTGAARDLDKVGTAADAAGKKTKGLGTAAEAASRHTDALGDNSSQAARKIDKLDHEIKKVNQDLVFLAAQLADADDAAGRMDISRGIRKSQADLKRLTNAKGVLSGLLPDPGPAAKSFTQKLGAGLVDAGATVGKLAGNNLGITIGAAAAAAAAPVLIPALSSALSAGAGLGVIGAGVALAVKNDKKIQEAGAAAGKLFIAKMGDGAKAFRGPVLESIGVLGDAGSRIAVKWTKAFGQMSGSVVPFVKDVTQGVERISDAFVNVAGRSQPAIAGLGDAWKLVADGVGDGLESMSNGSEEAASNLVLLGGVVGSTVRGVGDLINMFNQAAGNPWITGPIIPQLKKNYQEAADATGTFTKHTQGLTQAQQMATTAAQAHRDSLAKLATEMLAATDPAFALLTAQDKVRDSQKALTEATEKHGKKSREAREATRNLATAALELQGKVGALGATFDGKLTPSMRNTLRSAGLTKGQIAAVEGEMRRAKRAGDAYARNYKANVSVSGTKMATLSLKQVRVLAADIPRSVTIAMRITGVGNVSKAAAAIRKNQRASGGPIARGIPYLVGEEGPEMIVPEAAGRVLSAAATRGALRGNSRQGVTTAGNGGMVLPAGGVTARVELVGSEEFRVFFRKMVRTMDILPTASAASA